jgi:hypothetical protein
MEACPVKRVAGTCIELCVYIFQLLLFVKISYFRCRNSVLLCLSTITEYVEIQRALTLVLNICDYSTRYILYEKLKINKAPWYSANII